MFAAKMKKWAEKWVGKDVTEKPLSVKERTFCLSYTSCYNAAQAAISAGFPAEKAALTGSKMLKSPQIISEIMKIREARGLAIDMCQADIVERYMAIAFSDVTDFVEFGSETLEAEGKPPKVVNFMRLKPSASVNGTVLSQIAIDGDKLSIKTEDRMKALEWLTEYFKLNHIDRLKLKNEKMKMLSGNNESSDKLHIEIRRKEESNDETEGN